jgi:signal transduction histidine kinase
MGTDAARAVLSGTLGRAPSRLETRLGLAGAALCVGATAVAASGAPSDAAVGRALLELLIVAVPVAAGLYVLRAELNPAWAIALVTVGFSWSLTALAESSLSVPYTIGRLATWLVFPGVVYLLLAFPDGHIAPGLDRALFASVVVLSLVLFFGTAPLLTAYPPHTPWATCTVGCPANAVALVTRPPAWLSKVILFREWMVELIWVGLFFSMWRHWRGASPLSRRVMGPVFLSAVALGLCHCAFHTTRQLGAPAATVEALGSAWTFCIVLTCGAIFAAMVWRRTLLTDAMRRLGSALKATDATQAVRDALAKILGDPTLQLLIRDAGSGTWRDPSGHPADAPASAGAGRAVTRIGGGDGELEVALSHDVALRDDEELLQDATGMVLASLRHDELVSSLVSATSNLEASRQRIAEAALVERTRIERDLHDGAQQQLIAVRIGADIAEELLASDLPAAIEEIHKLGLNADRALAELRSLARGVYPALLTDHGLVAALRSVARDAAMPVRITASGVTRHSIQIESAIYFTCIEGIQNATKHASGATGVWLTLTESDGVLHFTVRDDGVGFDPSTVNGRGLRNMRDRIEALGGRVTVETGYGHGTSIVGGLDVARRPPGATR